METPTTSKHARPFFGRSHSAAGNVSPPRLRTQAATHNAAKRIHLHPLQTANERIHRHGGLVQSAKDHVPGHHLANELGKIAAKGSLTKETTSTDSRQDSPPAAASAEIEALSRVTSRLTRPEDVERERQRQQTREQ